MSSELSTSSLVPAPTEGRVSNFVPFRAWVRLVPNLGTGKRRTLVHNLQKASALAELSLLSAIDTTMLTNTLVLSTPIAFTPQFGDFTARLTIVGFVAIDSVRPVHPTTDVRVIHSGTDEGERTSTIGLNKGGSLSEGQDTESIVDIELSDLRSDLIIALDPTTGSPGLPGFQPEDIVHIEYNGVKYGTKNWGGRSLT